MSVNKIQDHLRKTYGEPTVQYEREVMYRGQLETRVELEFPYRFKGDVDTLSLEIRNRYYLMFKASVSAWVDGDVLFITLVK